MTNDVHSHSGSDLFPALESNLYARILAPVNLRTAWKQVRRNKGAAGVDGISIEDYPQWVKSRWPALRRALVEGYYQPQPVKRVAIPKPSGGERHLGIPTVHDRVIQQAISQVLTPIIDPTFSNHSYGFRPGKRTHGAVTRVQHCIKQGLRVAVDIDLSKFFDQVNHDLLMTQLGKHIRDKRVLSLIGKYLRAGIQDGTQLRPSPLGVPQGGPLSPLLANVMLDPLDKYLEKRQLPFARYADDFVICVKSSCRGHRVKRQVGRFLERKLQLPINQEKSAVRKTDALEFLGFTFKGKQIRWSDKAIHHFKYRVRQLTGRSWGVSMQRRIRELNQFLTGWINYFALAKYYRPLPLYDEWIRRRLRMCYLKQWRRPRTRIRNLIKLGVPEHRAITLGMSSKGPYRLAKTFATNQGISNRYLESVGLISVKGIWVKFHYPNG